MSDSPFVEENSIWYRENVTTNYFVSYVKAMTVLKGKGKRLTNVDSKLYYKLRHNYLKTTVLTLLGLESYKERPFCAFPILGLDSERTPDYLYVTEDSAYLIEFTISSRYETILKTKGMFSKYDLECGKSFVPIDSYYIYLTLDGTVEEACSVIATISDKYEVPVTGDLKEELNDVLTTIKQMTAHIADYMPEILSMNIDELVPQVDVTVIEIPDPFPVHEQLMGKRSYKSQRIRSLLVASLRKLSHSLRRRTLDVRYCIKMNFITRNVYLDEDPNGLLKEELIDLLDSGSSRLHDYCLVTDDVYNEASVFDMYAADENIDLDSDERPRDFEHVVDTRAYEERMIHALHRYPMKTLIDSSLEEDSKKVSTTYMASLKKLKDRLKPIAHGKSPFIFPVSDVLRKGSYKGPIDTGSPLTDIVLRKAAGCDIPRKSIIERDVDYDALLNFERKTSKLYRELRSKVKDYKKYNNMPMKALLEENNDDARAMVEFRKSRSELGKLVKESTRTAYNNRIKINLKVDSRWGLETEHFSQTKNVHREVQGLDYDNTVDLYRSFLSELFSPTDTITVDEVYSDTAPIGQGLANLCREMKSELDGPMNLLRTTRLAHSLLLISQFSHSLLFYSNIKLNKDDFIFDNLGYSDTLLIVKGGKTVRRTKCSRFFRLLHPITEQQSKLYTRTSSKIVEHHGKLYLVSPWRMLRFDYLKKGVELYHSFMSYFVASQLESSLSFEEYTKFASIKVLMMFSQKRRLEVWLSTLRYIYLNALGTHSELLTLVESMPILDTDSLTFMLQRSFALNYHKIYANAKEKLLYDLIWDTTSNNFDLMAERFDEVMFMAKAPFNPHNEHIKNLKSLIDTHRYYLDYVGTLDPIEGLKRTAVEIQDDYYLKLEENDFNFDPKASYIVGDFIGSYISSSCPKSDMQEKFNTLLERSFTEVASSKGMRSAKGYFWGQKGNEVIYDNLDIKLQEFLNDFPDNPKDFNKATAENEVTFLKKISDLKGVKLEFDMKDKRQYKDSREIFVMSDETKILQNPIEKFFGYLCKFVPNELIQRPSNTRPRFIHYKMFEHSSDRGVKLYCTMDCRKWAPRSNLWKYYFFVRGMSRHLPKSFTDFFFKFWTLMFSKRVRIQASYIENLKLNEGYADIEKLLLKRDDGAFELVMPYSFMMGIFNYLSSIMHAASQLFFNDIILNKEPATVNFLAHSDDSGGVITADSMRKCLRTYSHYEKFQRSLNHLMSRKKCCLSVRSFEMISIMYCDRKYIPMTHKFLSNISLDCKGGGWYDDITAVCGKVVDLYNNGGTHLQCYSLLLSSIELLRKAYHLPRVKQLSQVPLAFGGVPNYHPVHMIMVGNTAQECLLDLVEDEKSRGNRIAAYIAVLGDYLLGAASSARYRTPYFKMYDKRPDLKDEQKDLLSAFATLPLRSTLVSYSKHIHKTFDKKYVFSLTGFDTDQITLATLFYKQSLLLPDDTAVPLSEFVNVYLTAYLTGRIKTADASDYPTNNYTSYFSQTEGMKFHYEDFTVTSQKSCKPVVYNTVEMFDLKISQESLLYLSAVEKDPRIASLFPNPEKFIGMRDYLMASLPGTLEDKKNFLKLYKPSEKEEKARSGYLFMPSSVNIDTPARFFTYSLVYTTRRYLISKKRPQLYTPSEFNLETQSYDDLKHLYLLMKLLEKGDMTIDDAKASINGCPVCKEHPYAISSLTKYYECLNHLENKDFHTRLAFVDYNKRQRRGKNVWYANADFTLYTNFGRVTSTDVEGTAKTVWEVPTQDNLSHLYGLYKIFCVSRGIKMSQISYSHTGFASPKLGFNDFKTVYMPPLSSKAVVLANSEVRLRDVDIPLVHRRGNKIYMNNRPLDFKIYSVADINKIFYDTHNLSAIKKFIYKSDLSITEDLLLRNFQASKSYKLLLNDDRHTSGAPDKYRRNGLLGQPGSFTRALALSDEKGETRYRSSYNHVYINKGVIEYDSIEGVPVLDMFEKVNYARLTAAEKTAFEKVLNKVPITTYEKEMIVRVKNKLGLEALGTAVVLHKHVFEAMLAGSVVALPKEILRDVLAGCLEAVSESMSSYPETNTRMQYTGSRRSWWTLVKLYSKGKLQLSYFSTLLARAMIRSKADDPNRFWGIVSKNVLLSSMTVHSSYYSNLESMIEGMVLKLKDEIGSFFVDQDGNPRYRHLALARDNLTPDRFAPEQLTFGEYRTGTPTLYEGEEALDLIEEDAEGEIEDIEDISAERLERPFDEDNEAKTVYLYSKKDVRGFAEEAAQEDYSMIEIYNPVEYVSYPWFGPGDFEKVVINSVEFYRSSFPGKSRIPPPEKTKIKLMNARTLEEVPAVNVREPPQHVPRSLTSKEEAVAVLKELGIFDSRVVNTLFPEVLDMTKVLEHYLSSYQDILDLSGAIKPRRLARKMYLPGFQGILEDSVVVAEMKAIFGENCYYIFNGNVRLSETSYKHYMRMLRRLLREANANEKSLIIFLISLVLDTTEESDSDGWFMEKMNELIERMEERIYGSEDDIEVYAPASSPNELDYVEEDIF
jgi:hypothetical protein